MKQQVNIVWFKRDLRLHDHKPLQQSIEGNYPCILLYCFEPSMITYADSDIRHWRFVYESLLQMQQQLLVYKTAINIFYNEAINVFQWLQNEYDINTVFSYEETGNNVSFDRDKLMQLFFKKNNITWIETPTNGIIRG